MVMNTLFLDSINFRPATGGDGALPCTSVPVDHR